MKSLTFGLLTKGKSFIKGNIEEIRASPALRKYGFFLSFIHFFTFAYWFSYADIYNLISRATPAFCQPFFQSCEVFRFGTPELWRWILVAYFLAGLLSSALWLMGFIRWAYIAALVLFLFKFFIYIQDYRLTDSYHYIHFLFLFLFLFVPRKLKIIPFAIVLIYWVAGIQQLNMGLSGIRWTTAYVLVLELFFSTLLLSSKPFWQKFALIQFFIFHIYSIQFVGLFYPAVMLCVLSIFIPMFKAKNAAPGLSEIWHYKPHRNLVFLFILAQLYPVVLPGKAALTGEGRLLALNIFASRATCRHSFVVEMGAGRYQQLQIRTESIGAGIRCEPYLYLEFARRLCEDFAHEGNPAIVDIHLQSRLSSENNFSPIVDQKNICQSKIRFNPLFSNSWIEKGEPATEEVTPWFYQNAKIEASDDIFMYRGDAQRSGTVLTKELIHPLSRPFWRKPNWNASALSVSKSSAVSDGKAVYVGSDQGYFAAVDSTGKEFWRWIMTAKNGVLGSALIAGDSVFWGDAAGILYSAQKKTGALNWLLPIGRAIDSSPLYDDGFIYVSVTGVFPEDGFVAKVDARTGKLLWKSPSLGDQVQSSPALSEDGKLVFVGSNNGYLTAIDKQTGNFVWRYGAGLAIKGTPLVAAGSVIFCSWDQNLYRLNSTTGELIWNAPLESDCQSSATWSKKENAIYISTLDGATSAFDFSTGKELWQHQGSGSFLSSPVLLIKNSLESTEQLLASCFEQELCIFNSKNGSIKRKINLGDRLSSVPWINNGELIYTLDSAGGLVQWK